ncbi:hypothetical protein M9H77_04414 [Catharanthus roseus]|uniref:Uncharacterized protein n=1 Tax=Catharanthus roseus TaxID=4058 RepID=A0ACC0CEI4_CATRO|nr:hypothetical protein M9H77_04414 [Catharanthus roseus]
MKAHFVDAHPSFGKVPDRIKNMWYTKFRKRYRWDPMHESAIWDAWQKRASLRYKDLIYEVRVDGYQPDWMTTAQYTNICYEWGLEVYKKRQEVAQQNRLQGRVGQGPASTPAGLGLLSMREDRRGLRTGGPICPIASAEGTVYRYMIR